MGAKTNPSHSGNHDEEIRKGKEGKKKKKKEGRIRTFIRYVGDSLRICKWKEKGT